MRVTSFTVFVCALTFVVWGAIMLRNRLWERRRRARKAAWEALARHHSDLDRELERVWHGG